MASATLPLPADLAGTTVSLKDSSGATLPAPLIFVSPAQVNLLIPPGSAAGQAILTVISGAEKSVSTQIEIAAVSPSLFTVGEAGIAAAYAVLANPDNTQTVESVFTDQAGVISATPLAVDTGPTYLVLYGTGLDTASISITTVTVEGVNAPVYYSGPQPTYAGLDQINVLLPPSLAGTGVASVVLSINGTEANTVYIYIR